MDHAAASADARARLAVPALAAGLRSAAWLGADDAVEELSHGEAAARLRRTPPLVCHGPATARRLGLRPPIAALDLLELYAFVWPASFALPTPRGVARTLGLEEPVTLAGEARALRAAAEHLLADLADPGYDDRDDAIGAARAMAGGGWAWAPHVLAALGVEAAPVGGAPVMLGLEAWRGLPEWADRAPEPPPGNQPVSEDEARGRLAELLGGTAEERPQQGDYAAAAAGAFQPRAQADVPRFVIAEAGTGVGKTLGYIAPASVWAEKNRGAVWISTYTRNLQHQIDQELDRLAPDPAQKRRRVVLRKGRENYLCLLNMEEAAAAARLRSADAVPLGLLARWASRTRDGAVVGGDFPGWLADLVGRARVQALTDHRGECIYSACRHYRRCYIEHSARRARRADIVVANHALVMIQAALGSLDEASRPRRLVFDEGHHVFDAADSAFSGHLTGLEAAELRRWLRGAETRRSGGASRVRGLQARAGDLAAGDEEAEKALDAALKAALALPGEGWMQRLAGNQPAGTAEQFLALVRQQVYARARDRDSPYGLETETDPPVDGLLDAATALDGALDRLMAPMIRLGRRLAARLDEEADELDRDTRIRIEAVCRSLHRRGEVMLGAWRAMLQALHEATPGEYVDWFSVDREFGRDSDIGLHRHWIDPTIPFAEAVAVPSHGVLVTSATLRDGTGDDEADWTAAEIRTGAAHLPAPAVRAAVASPFDYPANTRVYVVTDVRKDAMDQVAAAMRALFVAAGGGAIGLFTAISRLRAVHRRIAPALEAEGLPLLAQHVDGLDTTTLIDIFRAEESACLLGTDAVRDGVDVPGRSLRLLVFDRVPWPRPDILHRARREAFGKRGYDDMLTRLRLKQAFGRLVRRADDRGVFVLLDPMMPSRLLGAFPEGVPVARVGLAEAVDGLATFFRQNG